MPSANTIALSVIVTIVGGKAPLQRCLSRLFQQLNNRPIEVIVPYDSTSKDVVPLRKEFPQVRFLDVGIIKTNALSETQAALHEIYDRRTAQGLDAARGKILAILQDYGAPDPDWCNQILEAHQLPYGVIGGAVEHEGKGALNWAVYFLDFGRYQLPLREGAVNYITDVNVSYKRAVLEPIKELWAERYHEVKVNWELARRGVVFWQRPQIIVRQDRGKLSLADLVVERFCWGRLFGALRVQEISFMSRLMYIIFGPGIPIILVGRMVCKVFSGRHNRLQFLLSFPQTVLLTLVWSLGEMMAYLTGREHSSSTKSEVLTQISD